MRPDTNMIAFASGRPVNKRQFKLRMRLGEFYLYACFCDELCDKVGREHYRRKLGLLEDAMDERRLGYAVSAAAAP
jgi:hypothetical protein